MDFEKYTERARGFIQSAQSLALREGHQRFSPEHLLKVLLDDEEGLASGLIAAARDSRVTLCAWRVFPLRRANAARHRCRQHEPGLRAGEGR